MFGKTDRGQTLLFLFGTKTIRFFPASEHFIKAVTEQMQRKCVSWNQANV
jgi:hypothetical protein